MYTCVYKSRQNYLTCNLTVLGATKIKQATQVYDVMCPTPKQIVKT